MESLKEKPNFEKVKHTPLPWSERRFDGTFLQGADAKLIVEACNNYYSLQKELTLAKEEIERLKQELEANKQFIKDNMTPIG